MRQFEKTRAFVFHTTVEEKQQPMSIELKSRISIHLKKQVDQNINTYYLGIVVFSAKGFSLLYSPSMYNVRRPRSFFHDTVT